MVARMIPPMSIVPPSGTLTVLEAAVNTCSGY